MNKLFVLLFFVFLSSFVSAQPRYWVYFKDKNAVEFNPHLYFDQKTIDKRLSMGIELYCLEDVPLNEEYCSELEQITQIRVRCRWMNAVSVALTSSQLNKVEFLPFVTGVEKIESQSRLSSLKMSAVPDDSQMKLIYKQKEVMGSQYFADREINGKGVRIAILDAGFSGVDTISFFKEIRDEGRIIATYDFVKKRDFVYDFNSHGTSVFACIAGSNGEVSLGLGTGAEFLLARTEVKAEVFSEEENWAAAVEWADKHGADIINSSLGYTFNRYFPRQMDGKHTFVTRMATAAARKGILVINAAGNDGNNKWQVIGAPADADSILSVGGINSKTGMHSDFSSFGPTFDGRLKPEIVTFSDVITVNKKGDLRLSYGTSFAAPLATGFAACVKQMHPEWDNMMLYREICKSGHLYPYYDYAHGYGVPQADYFTGDEIIRTPTFTLEAGNESVQVRVQSPSQYSDTIMVLQDSTENRMSIINRSTIEEYDTNLTISLSEDGKMKNGTAFGQYELFDKDYLYFHFADKSNGKIRVYKVVRMPANGSYSIDTLGMKNTEVLRVNYRGYTDELQLEGE